MAFGTIGARAECIVTDILEPNLMEKDNMTARNAILCLAVAQVLLAWPCAVHAQVDGFVESSGTKLFPVGFYELPKDDVGLKDMAAAGVNLVRCHSRADLDRVQGAGMLGVYPLPFQRGNTEALQKRVAEVAGHPALAVWEGPDEIVWNFTAYSGLFRKMGMHKKEGAWWDQSPEAVAYAREKAADIIPNMRAAVAMIRESDPDGRPVWLNEALKSDTAYVRQYLDFVDITGCDTYPVRKNKRDVASMGGATERWNQLGRGKPVWMVLQAFSWDELGEYYDVKDTAYPTFAESRFMAYDVIVHGARGILYWGSHYLKSEPFRQSVYALTSELAALQPFLVAPDAPGVGLEVVEIPNKIRDPNVMMIAREREGEWLVILVNEDRDEHMGVVVTGLDALSGREMHQLYADETVAISNGELITRMQAHDVEVFTTSRNYETARRQGRDFVE